MHWTVWAILPFTHSTVKIKSFNVSQDFQGALKTCAINRIQFYVDITHSQSMYSKVWHNDRAYSAVWAHSALAEIECIQWVEQPHEIDSLGLILKTLLCSTCLAKKHRKNHFLRAIRQCWQGSNRLMFILDIFWRSTRSMNFGTRLFAKISAPYMISMMRASIIMVGTFQLQQVGKL